MTQYPAEYTLLAFDFGLKYIGVAVGQSITKTATPLKTLRAIDGIPNWQEILDLINAWRPYALIVGRPLTMQGEAQLLSFCARKFAGRLQEKSKLKVFQIDERLSSWEAKQQLGLVSGKLNKKEALQINAQAAGIILEQWFQEQSSY